MSVIAALAALVVGVAIGYATADIQLQIETRRNWRCRKCGGPRS